MFTEGSFSSHGGLQRLCVNNIPQQTPLFHSADGLPRPPRPATHTGTTPESYLDWPGRAARGFVKLPPVISPARRSPHTPMWAYAVAACRFAFIRCIHSDFSSNRGWAHPPASDKCESNPPVAVTHQVQQLPPSRRWWAFIRLASVCQGNVSSASVTITSYCSVRRLNSTGKWSKTREMWYFKKCMSTSIKLLSAEIISSDQ